MWCKNCRQDVPIIATPEAGVKCCAKCRQEAIESPPVATGAQAAARRLDAGDVPAWAFVETPPVDVDAWQWDPDLHEAKRLVRSLGPTRERHVAHPPGPPAPAWGTERARQWNTRGSAARRPTRSRSAAVGILAWSALSLGVMALVFGGVLLGWSCWSGHQRLWTIGLPFALGGQAALILGLVLQLDGVWQSSRDSATALTQLDEQLDELRHTTTLLTNSHSGHAQSFYFHLAEGASPHMLLADLKGQLDLLALRMAKDAGP